MICYWCKSPVEIVGVHGGCKYCETKWEEATKGLCEYCWGKPRDEIKVCRECYNKLKDKQYERQNVHQGVC